MSENKEILQKSNKANYLLVLASFLLALIVTELLLKNYYKKYSDKYWTQRYNVFQEGKVFQNIENFFKYFPNKSILLETYYHVDDIFVKEFSHTIKTNNFGLVQENDIQKNKASILFLGDSIGEGHGAFSWINKFNGSFKDLQVINGGILGTGPEQFQLIENHISKKFDVKKVVVMYIGDDLRRGIWNMPENTIKCLNNHQVCKGDENFYGFPFGEKPVIPFLTNLQKYRNEKVKNDKNLNSIKKIRRKIRFFLKDLYIFKLPEGILKKKFYKSKNKEIINSFKALNKLFDRYQKNIIFIRIMTKAETINRKSGYESVYTEDYIKKFTDKHFICDFDGDSKSFYKHDPHPNSFGYNKLYKCVKEIISKNFVY